MQQVARSSIWLTFGRYSDTRGSVVCSFGTGRRCGAEDVDEAGGVGEVRWRQRELAARCQVTESGGPAGRVLLLLVLVAPDE